MDWFKTTTDIYKHHKPDLLHTKLQIRTKKSKYFDVLLGVSRRHRDFVYAYLLHNKGHLILISQCLM